MLCHKFKTYDVLDAKKSHYEVLFEAVQNSVEDTRQQEDIREDLQRSTDTRSRPSSVELSQVQLFRTTNTVTSEYKN